MSTTRDLGEYYGSMYQWLSTPDSDGDQVILGNTRGKNLVVHIKQKNGRQVSALVDAGEIVELALAALDLKENIRPSVGDSEESEL